MKAHRIEATMGENGTLILRDLPFDAGDSVIVVILERDTQSEIVSSSTPSVELENSDLNPLLKICGIVKEGGKADGGENHDKYLYGSDPM